MRRVNPESSRQGLGQTPDDFVVRLGHAPSVQANIEPPESTGTIDEPIPSIQPDVEPPKPRHRKRKWFLIAFLVLLISGLAFAVYLSLNLAKVSINPLNFNKLAGEADGRVNILLLGIGDPGHDGAALSDTNMVVSINTKTNQVAMISVPRDTWVSIPGHGSGKINNANADGGVDLAKQVIEQTLGLKIQYYVVADFTGLKQVVDAVGGVDINVKDTLVDPTYPCDNNQYKSCGLRINKGQQHMDGATALKYARCRKGNCGDDFGRALRQQEVLTAVRKNAMSLSTLTNPVRLSQLTASVGDNIKTDLSISNLIRLNDISKKIDTAQIMNIVFSLQPNGFLIPGSAGELLPKGGSFDAIQKFVANVFTTGPIWVEAPIVTIENGTTTPGLAGKLNARIEADGQPIDISAVTNAKDRNVTTTKIIDYTGTSPNTLKYLQGVLGVTATQPETPVKNPTVDLEIILGSDYAASTASTPSSSSPTSGQ